MKELNLWVLPNNGFDTAPTLRDHLVQFHRNHPELRVRVSVVTASALWSRLFRVFKDPRGETRPDVAQLPSHWTSSLAFLGLLRSLSELDPALELSRWTTAAQEHCRLAGTDRIYSLPWWSGLRVLYYRKDVFRKLGIRAEEALPDWEGLRETCRTLSRRWAKPSKGLYPIANPNPRRCVSLMDVAPCLWSRGGDLFASDGSRVLFQRSRSIGGVRDYFDLIASGWMPLHGPSGLAPGDLFDGAAAMQITGRFPRELLTKGTRPVSPAHPRLKDIGAVPLPPTGEKPSTVCSFQNLVVLKDSRCPEEAYSLVLSLVEKEAAGRYARALGAFPTLGGSLLSSLDPYPEFQEVFRRSGAAARALPNIRVLGTLERVFDRCMERLVREVVRRSYCPEHLQAEVIHAAAEMDYVLSVAGEPRPGFLEVGGP